MLPEALSAPTRSHDATGTILVGGLLVLFSVLFPLIWLFSLTISPVWLVLAPLAVFPPLITLGYDLRVLETGMRRTEATPPFLGWAQLARDGAQSIALGLIYLVPALVVLGAASAIVAGVETGELGLSERVATAVLGVTTAVAGGFVLLYGCVFLYIRPATLAVFASTGRLWAALSPQQVLQVALSREYAVGWAVAVIVLLIGWTIAAPLQLLIIGFFVAFYVRAVAYYAYGSGARAALSAPTEASLGAERIPAVEQSGDAEEVESAPEEYDAGGEPGIALSWSPRFDPEATAPVQVGRGVSLSGDGHGDETHKAGTESDQDADDAESHQNADEPEGDRSGDRTTDRSFEWEDKR
jgi:hypothetical protein